MSNFYVGTKRPIGGYVGTNKVAGIYLGTEKVWSAEPECQCLCFTASGVNPQISMGVLGTPVGQDFKYSTDGENWNTFIPGTTTVTLSPKVYFKGNNPNGINSNMLNYLRFQGTTLFYASGNIMSLIDDGACTCTTIPNRYCFAYLFSNCTPLQRAPSLPATTLTQECYSGMFYQCKYLDRLPNLPATTLATDCYKDMFCGCTGVVVQDNPDSYRTKPWRIPTEGTFTNTLQQRDVFEYCSKGSGRASDNIAGVAGQSYTYYLSYAPV